MDEEGFTMTPFIPGDEFLKDKVIPETKPFSFAQAESDQKYTFPALEVLAGKAPMEKPVVEKPYVKPRRSSECLEEILAFPEMAVDLLEDCGGDIDLFVKKFGEPAPVVLTRVLYTLSLPDYMHLKPRWDGLIAAFKNAKILLAEHAAFEFISNYKLPDVTDGLKLNEFIAVAKFWMAGHSTTETTKARRAATDSMPTADSFELEHIINKLAGDKDARN